ncbi:cupincin-like [Canna indica]|uniref:Cupincin-like n=1 Tax=Canna indica TaxID=4628 RepID=A0AAQ3KYC8_9LILI|nr:cupincin-like [Canna indica]
MATSRPLRALFPLLLLLLSSSLLPSSFGSSDPEKRRCRVECGSIPEHRQRKECVRQCLDREREGATGRDNHHEGEESEGQSSEHHPYHFGRRSYKRWTRTEHGRFEVLQRFDERSEQLRGIANYRLALLEAEPETFILPSHFDADEVFYVMEGCGTVTLLQGENRESHDIKRGDIMMIPAGVIVYAINRDKNERLRIAMLLRPISTPGEVEEFFGAAGQHPRSFYTSFSNEVQEAAFNSPREKIERLFGHQRKGEIIKISQEQIQALRESAAEGSGRFLWPFAQSNRPFNLLQSRPAYSNDNGELYEVTPEDYKQIHDLNIHVAFVNITQGSMMAPHYNTLATHLVMVVRGEGYVEMTCPRQSSQQKRKDEEHESESTAGYQTVRSRLSHGSAFVIPAGIPVTVVASPNTDLEAVAFGIRSENSRRHYLAGRNNVLSRMDRVAKQLAFGGVRVEEVDEVLNAQREQVFLPGPERRREEERGGRRASRESLLSSA